MGTIKKTDSDTEEIFCAGFGGQGIMFMGKLFAEAALAAGRYVTWMPSYGAEVRGGTAYSMVKISKKEIASPVVTNPSALIVMNKPSLLKYENKVKPGGILIANKSLIDEGPSRKDIKTVNIPMTALASSLGNTRCANMVASGAFVKRSKMITLRNVLAALKEALKGKEDLFLLNKKALEKGYRL
ncbi:MAG: 2-oxoacid:acceptor oxidoreductase family protein [Candidatus Omnitrophota bacterium]